MIAAATPAPPAAIGIVVRDLTLCLNNRVLFDKLNFTLDGGQCAAVLGASGVGKTSLLKIIAGLTPADAGTVSGSDGLPLAGRIAYMGQKDLLYPWLTVKQNITLGARLRREKAESDWADYLLAEVGLDGVGACLPAAISGGMRQRAALARTLYERQPVVLMDEPFSALDTLTRAKIQALSARLLSAHTVMLITHDPLEACRLSHRLWVLAGQPARFLTGLDLAGEPPRAPDDPAVQQSQGALLRQLLRSAE
ncbi:ABC transporter ATP-binding protein [Sodalis praecaptivus]|uniref:ABC transporter ATP-binding protein n=1 Tax=Sodalis praecaptivus TaxID=1239307 RepID=UPI0027E834AC|nr:ABC transporter ATP-binding protein [Sodalis praecaptivus]CAJ0997062.1 Vitamin B12 import ATP-binding protein BtuD [Sodalis praecaptivus]